MNRFLLMFLLAGLAGPLFGSGDTLSAPAASDRSLLKQQLIPAALISGGVLLEAGRIKQRIHDWLPRTNTRVDDYLQHVPAGLLAVYDLAGADHSSSGYVQAKCYLAARGTSDFLVHVLKHTISGRRPSGGRNSFPSSHTSHAFVGATLLYREYREYSPLLACSGYAVATATACLRMTNDAHWLPDVMVGAGLGILVTNLVYNLDPIRCQPRWLKGKKMTVVPLVGAGEIGLAARW